MSVELIREILSRLNASMKELHGGNVDFLSYEKGVLKVRLGGACVGCTISDITLEKGILSTLKKYVPSIEKVVSIELADEAICPNCSNPVDECNCVCPYCGETGPCNCCVGFGVATGG